MGKKSEVSFPLDLEGVSVVKTEINKHGDYVITVESSVEQTECHQCGRTIKLFYSESRWINLRHLPILGHIVWIRICPKRYQCRECETHPTTSEGFSWHDSKSPHTRAYDDYLLKCLINSTVEDVHHKEAVGYDAVEGVLARRINRKVDWTAFQELGTIGMDEIALRKGKRDFVLIISTQQSQGHVAILAVLTDRKKESARQFFESIPVHLRASIKTICSDMWEGYINAAKEFAEAHREELAFDIVIDRFHVAKAYREGVDDLRKQEVQRLKKQLSAEAYEEIKGTMWACRKNKSDLSPSEHEKLQGLFGLAPDLERAYAFREDLTAIFQSTLERPEALLQLQAWQDKVQASGLTCFKKFLTTLTNWRGEIANYFIKRRSSGFVEGLNNKLKTIKRRCYGLSNISHLFQRLYLDLEGFRLFA